jgi:hypothetical protein
VHLKYPICLIVLALLNCFSAAFADDNKMTVEQFQKMLDCQKDAIKRVDITNGQPLFDVKVADKEVHQLVDVNNADRKKLIQQVIASGVPLTIHDDLMDWVKDKFGGNHAAEKEFGCSQLATLLVENKANTISQVDVIDGSNVIDVQITGEPQHEFVMPVEIKQEVIDQLASKGVKVDHKAAKLDFGYILPGFILGVLGLGALYMFSPMRLASEVNPRPNLITPQSTQPQNEGSAGGTDSTIGTNSTNSIDSTDSGGSVS